MNEKKNDHLGKDSIPANELHIWFQTKPVSLSPIGKGPYRAEFDGFHFVEALIADKRFGDGTDRVYVIRIFRGITNQEKYDQALLDFGKMRQKIESVWHYIFGYTYGGDEHDFEAIGDTRKWSDNTHELYKILNSGRMRLPQLQWTSRSSLQLKYWPLGALIHALKKYEDLSETLKFLMNLHAKAIETEDIDIRITLFGKLADMCGWLLPRVKGKPQINGLPIFMKKRLVNDENIFKIANTKSLTRHAMKQNGCLHDGMSKGEMEDFQSDVDTLVRHLVLDQLGTPPVFDESWRYPREGSHRYEIRVGKERSIRRDELRSSQGRDDIYI